MNALKTERDVSVRQRAVDLLYAMCDKTNAEEIVSEMLSYLETADYSIREEMVLKVAILAEKYASDYTWYVDVILNLIRIAGDYVSEEVWYRVIQIVINRDDVQGYAAKTVFEALQAPACHENMVKVSGYILGEFGNLIAGDPRSGPLIQFQLLHSKYHLCSVPTRALLLTTYVKFINLFPEIRSNIQSILNQDSNVRSSDAELQQRTVEYLQLSKIASTDVLATVLEEMPPFTERESSILAILKKKKPGMSEAINTTKEFKNDVPSGTANADLLGLNNNSPPASAGATNNGNLLFDLLDNPTPSNKTANNNLADESGVSASTTAAPTIGINVSNEEGLAKLVCKSNGILFESDLIQIGVKCEYKQNLGRLCLYYGNKSNVQFLTFMPVVQCLGNLSKALSVQVNPVEPLIDAGAQVQQILNVECLDLFKERPTLIIQFSHNAIPVKYNLELPMFLNKFFEPTSMNAEQFFTRWKNLNNPVQEAQEIFKAKHPINSEHIKAKLVGFGMQILDNIDPNPDNFVTAGIVHTSSQKVGCLTRLEPNNQAQMYRLTIRSSRDIVSQQLCRLLYEQF